MNRHQRHSISILIALLITAVLLGLVLSVEDSAAAAPQSLTLRTSDVSGGAGATVFFDISIDDLVGFEELAAVKLCLRLDPAVLSPVGAVRSSQLDAVAAEDFGVSIEGGMICLSAISVVPMPMSPGVLFTVEALVGPTVGLEDVIELSLIDTVEHPLLLLEKADDLVGIKVHTVAGRFTGAEAPACARGDAIEDGVLDVGDAVLTLRLAADLIADPDAALLCRADATLDEIVDTGDAVWILTRVVGPPAKAALASAGRPAATLVMLEGRPHLVFENAGPLHGLELVLGFEPASVRLDSMGEAQRGMWLVNDRAEGSRSVHWAAGSSLADAGGRIEFELPATALRPDARLDLVELRAFDAAGAAVRVERSQDSVTFGARGGIRSLEHARILGNVPNPFNPTTVIRFELTRAARVSVEVFDVKGARVARLLDAPRGAGRFELVWNGSDAAGRPVASGVYLARLVSEGVVSAQRMLLLK